MTSKSLLTQALYFARDVRSSKLFEALQQHCTGHVLDVGGWDFFLTAKRRNVPFERWTTLEVDQERILTYDDPNFECVHGDGVSLPFEDDHFDTILCIQVLEHVFEPIRVVEEMARVLKPGGTLILLVPQTANLHLAPHHYQNFTRFWLLKVMERVQLDVLELHHLGGAWSTIASRLVYFFLQSIPSTRDASHLSYPEATKRRGLAYYLLAPFSATAALAGIPISLLLSLGDMEEEANNHLMVVRKPHAA